MRYYVDEGALKRAGIPEATIRLIRALSGVDFEATATADIPATHKLPIRVNGVPYFLLLSDT